MEARTDYERVKDHVHEDGEPGLPGLRVLPSMCIAQTARSVQAVGLQIMVTSLF